MNYKGFLPVATILLLSLSACMKDSPNPSDVTKEIKVSATIEGLSGHSKPNTRATNNSWEKNDAIGIFMKKSSSVLSSDALAKNVKYITNGSDAFTPADVDNKIKLPFNESVDFIAYYPYTDELDDGLNYKIDVSDQTNLPDIDLLYSQNLDNINSTSVDLTFQHQLVKMIFNIVSNPETDLTVLSMGITNMNTRADFSLVDGIISNESETKTVSFNLSEDNKVGQAILLPTNDLSNNSLIITFENTSYSFDLNKIEDIDSFDKTTRYTFDLTLKQGEDPTLESVSKSIEDWVDGPHKDITVDEDAYDEESGNNEPGGGENEGEGEGSDDGDGGDEGGGAISGEGDGTQTNPYSITQALTIDNATKVWVKGYIVGYYTSYKKDDFVNGIDNARLANIALASSPDETDSINTFPIDFQVSPTHNVSSKLNLLNNPLMFKKEVILYGHIDFFNKASGNAMGLNNVKKAIIEGALYQ